MRTLATVFFAAGLLSPTDAHATTTQSDVATIASPADAQTGLMQLAESNSRSPNKLDDKYLDGKAGGIYGIGGSEPHVKYFKNKMKKPKPCCTGKSQ
jgi:hypothetical protein